MNNLKAELVRKGITKEEAAKILGISYTSIISKIAGRRDFSLSEAKTLSEKLGCTIEYLFKKEQDS